MGDSASKPHDSLVRHLLTNPVDAASQIRPMVPDELEARVDWSALELLPCSFVSKHLRATYSDLLFRTRIDGHEAYLYFLLEHQSSAKHRQSSCVRSSTSSGPKQRTHS
ncbi:Rpn family recombination-promoting nuclease/putative transposase [Nocardia sp. NPDC058480]|uniref:Rpn family recombination-promoting nuclease/putative transposase n=1 Tax=unclassified Nocardia TaxID=2637762 RepID=UPI00365DF7AF